MTKRKNSNCDKTHNSNWDKLKNSNCEHSNTNCDLTKKFNMLTQSLTKLKTALWRKYFVLVNNILFAEKVFGDFSLKKIAKKIEKEVYMFFFNKKKFIHGQL